MEHLLFKRYVNHFGLDLKSNDIVRDSKYASKILNAQYSIPGSIEKRKGYQAHGPTSGGLGNFTYNRFDPSTNTLAREFITVDQNLFKYTPTTLNVAYSGAGASATISIYFDTVTDQYRCLISEEQTDVLDYALGLGFDEVSPVTIDDLAAQINAITGFATTITGAITTPAALLKIVRAHELTTESIDLEAGNWTQVNSTVSNPFSSYYGVRHTAEDFENVSIVQINNCAYLSNGYDDVHKYDGQTFYKAGLPTPTAPTATIGASGNITGSNYYYKAQFIQYDAAGNIVEGNPTISATGYVPSAQQLVVTLTNSVAGSGFNTNCATVSGSQNNVTTITVNSTHTLKEGDTAYFYDAVTLGHVTREVLGVSGTAIAIAGSDVTVTDDAVISNNLRIAIYRNKTSAITPTLFYLVAEVPNDSFNATQTYNDNLADGSLGALFVEPVTDRSPPPKGKYLTTFQNLLVVSGSRTYPQAFYWSDSDGPEYFPEVNQDLIQSPNGNIVTGSGVNGPVLAAYTETSTHVISGTLADSNYRIELKSGDIGCLAHDSLTDIEGTLFWWSKRGPYRMTSGQIPIPVGITDNGGRIESVMNQEGVEDALLYQTKRITSINWRSQNKWVVFLPCESTTNSNRHSNSNSIVYAYDYSRDAWLKWTNLDLMGGIKEFGSEVFFQERRYSTAVTATNKHVLYKMHNLNDAWDYQDNNAAIEMVYGSAWEALDQPSVLKRFLEVRVMGLDQTGANTYTVTVQQEMNYQEDAPVAEFTMATAGGGYGLSAYSTEPYGDPSEGVARHELRRDRTRSMRVLFINEQEQTNCPITGWELMIAAPYRNEFKK